MMKHYKKEQKNKYNIKLKDASHKKINKKSDDQLLIKNRQA